MRPYAITNHGFGSCPVNGRFCVLELVPVACPPVEVWPDPCVVFDPDEVEPEPDEVDDEDEDVDPLVAVDEPWAPPGWNGPAPPEMLEDDPVPPTGGANGSWAAATPANAISMKQPRNDTTASLRMGKDYCRLRSRAPLGCIAFKEGHMPIADLGDSQLFYREFGNGDPVLGIMGYSLDQRFWAGQVPAVTKTHRFITFDNRSIGRSTGAPPTTIDEMANDAVRLLDHLEIERTAVFGISMGGTIAQRLTLDHPDRVSALIAGVTWARPIEFMRRQHAVARMLLDLTGSTQDLLEITMLRMFTPAFFEVGREAIDQIVAAFSAAPGGPDAPSPESLLGQLDAMDKHDTLSDLPTVSCPTLVLGGKMDMLVPYFASEEIAAAIEGSQLVTFETGHGCMVEEMDAFNSAVSGFLASL